ncbi:unnamed protein product, partial [Meganyctiphanes norvegica]
MDVQVKNDNENSIKSEESYYPHAILHNSAYETVGVSVKYETEVKDEPIQIKKEKEINEEPIAFTVESHPVKQDLTHTAWEKTYQCSFCNKSVSQTEQLYIHMSSHQSVAIQKLESHPLPVPENTGNGLYKCTQCDIAISHKSRLTSHLRNHTGEKSYQCDKAFSLNTTLTIHHTTDTG